MEYVAVRVQRWEFDKWMDDTLFLEAIFCDSSNLGFGGNCVHDLGS
jgi:hypothetical protein